MLLGSTCRFSVTFRCSVVQLFNCSIIRLVGIISDTRVCVTALDVVKNPYNNNGPACPWLGFLTKRSTLVIMSTTSCFDNQYYFILSSVAGTSCSGAIYSGLLYPTSFNHVVREVWCTSVYYVSDKPLAVVLKTRVRNSTAVRILPYRVWNILEKTGAVRDTLSKNMHYTGTEMIVEQKIEVCNKGNLEHQKRDKWVARDIRLIIEEYCYKCEISC